MKPASFTAGSLLLALALCTWGADTPREWKSGTLFEMEKEQVRTGTTKRTNKDATVKDKGKKGEYSETTTSTKTDEYDTFQVYTIQGDSKTYIARERLLFHGQSPRTSPWAKR